MAVSIILWLALLLPGYALARRVLPEMVTEKGPLQTFAISTLGALALLSPASIIGYALGLPLFVIAGYCVALIVVGALLITKWRQWNQFARDFRAGAGVELIPIGVVALLSLGVGSSMEGDAVVHLARIRQLIDSGLTNADPFCSGDTFFPIYHTNILHVLYALPAQLGAQDYFVSWFAAIFWGNLFIASGVYTLARAVWGSVWPAMVATLYMLVAQHYAPFIAYPNQIAPHALLPIFLALLIHALSGDKPTIRDALVLGATACIIGQVHGLYAGFALLVALPPLLWFAFALFRKSKHFPATHALCIAALLPALAFPAITEYTRRAYAPPPLTEAQRDAQTQTPKPAGKRMFGFATPVNYTDLPGGMVIRDPFKGFGSRGGWRYAALVVGALILWRSPRRREGTVYLLAVGGVFAVFFVPPITTAALGILREGWVIDRLMRVPAVALAVLGAGGLAHLLLPRLHFWWARAGVAALIMLLATIAAPGREATEDLRAVSSRADRWSNFFSQALGGRPESNRRANREFIEVYRKRREVYSHMLAPGETILAHPMSGMFICAVADCRIIAPVHASLGVPDLRQRKQDLRLLLSPGIDWAQRERLLREYSISRVSLLGVPTAGEYLQRAKSRIIYPPDDPQRRFIDIIDLGS